MSNVIRIKRSVSTNTPSSLAQGEPAYSEDDSPNGEGELFIGTAGSTVTKITTTVLTGTDGVAAQPNASAQDNQTITTGLGLKGAEGGSSVDFTPVLALEELAATTLVAADHLAFADDSESTVNKKALVSGINLGLFSNDQNWNNYSHPNHTGDVTSVTDGDQTIVADAVTYPKMQNVVADDRILGNNSGADSIVDELTGTEVTAILDIVTISVPGLCPTLNNNSGQFLNGVGAYATPAGGGDVSFDGGIAPANNALVRYDGTTGTIIQESQIIVDDTDNVTGMGTLNGKTIADLISEDDTLVVANWDFVLDEDAMGSDSAVHLATQQSVKAYVDSSVVGSLTHKGGYNASTNTPALDTGSPVLVLGDMYTVTAAGTFFTVELEIGDVLISDVDSVDAAAIGDWTIVQKNIGAASETVPGFIEIANTSEADGGSDNTRAITSAKLHATTFDGGTF